MLSWRVYYLDGSTFDSSRGGPQDAPASGVLSIAMLRDAPWYGGDQWGLMQYLLEPGWKRVLFGRSVTDELFHQVSQRAADDPDFPPDRLNLNRKDFYWWEGAAE